mmetsp:Transcript_15354/g.48370  ORF Transcript_15354/g.48370 Transcript_15354/m.48370 type:complete len:243 (+) Transcript_15354:352-1080(+)
MRRVSQHQRLLRGRRGLDAKLHRADVQGCQRFRVWQLLGLEAAPLEAATARHGDPWQRHGERGRLGARAAAERLEQLRAAAERLEQLRGARALAAQALARQLKWLRARRQRRWEGRPPSGAAAKPRPTARTVAEGLDHLGGARAPAAGARQLERLGEHRQHCWERWPPSGTAAWPRSSTRAAAEGLRRPGVARARATRPPAEQLGGRWRGGAEQQRLRPGPLAGVQAVPLPQEQLRALPGRR